MSLPLLFVGSGSGTIPEGVWWDCIGGECVEAEIGVGEYQTLEACEAECVLEAPECCSAEHTPGDVVFDNQGECDAYGAANPWHVWYCFGVDDCGDHRGCLFSFDHSEEEAPGEWVPVYVFSEEACVNATCCIAAIAVSGLSTPHGIIFTSYADCAAEAPATVDVTCYMRAGCDDGEDCHLSFNRCVSVQTVGQPGDPCIWAWYTLEEGGDADCPA